jgi:hypothetical protein
VLWLGYTGSYAVDAAVLRFLSACLMEPLAAGLLGGAWRGGAGRVTVGSSSSSSMTMTSFGRPFL